MHTEWNCLVESKALRSLLSAVYVLLCNCTSNKDINISRREIIRIFSTRSLSI